MSDQPSSPSQEDVNSKKEPKIKTDQIEYNGWNISTTKSHILTSAEENALEGELELPHLPDMLFLHNRLICSHKNGLSLELNPVDALKRVNAHEDHIHVANSKDWLEARKDSPHINTIVHPYDWTFTTDYAGSFTFKGSDTVRMEETSDKINYQKLKIQEKIIFFDELVLYEDELDDNGCTKLIVKIRVMPSGFFILQRFYLRVDNTIIRVHDSRIYYEDGKDYMLREYSEREDKTTDLQVDRSIWSDPNLVVEHLTLKRAVNHKIFLSS